MNIEEIIDDLLFKKDRTALLATLFNEEEIREALKDYLKEEEIPGYLVVQALPDRICKPKVAKKAKRTYLSTEDKIDTKGKINNLLYHGLYLSKAQISEKVGVEERLFESVWKSIRNKLKTRGVKRNTTYTMIHYDIIF